MLKRKKIKRAAVLFIVLLVSLLAITMIYRQLMASSEKTYAGFRCSGGDPTYWVNVAKQMALAIPGTSPGGIWIVNIVAPTKPDYNDQCLTVFDDNGLKVWLQVEPGNRSIDDLIDLLLGHYGNHSCVLGFGIDLEWRRPPGTGIWGTIPVTDDEAERWVNRIKSYNQKFKLFLKHWLTNVMPPTVRQGIVFIDDSQGFPNFTSLVDEFKDWGEHFSETEVGFQIGYRSDEGWWHELDNPPRDIGSALIKNIPNCRYIYWTNETIREVFPLTQTSVRPIVAMVVIVNPRKDAYAHKF